MQYEVEEAQRARPRPNSVNRLNEQAYNHVPSAYPRPTIPGMPPVHPMDVNTPDTNHPVFRLLENRWRWGVSTFWDMVTETLQGARQHYWDLPYQPPNTGGTPSFGGYYSADEIAGDTDEGPWEDDEEDPEDEPTW